MSACGLTNETRATDEREVTIAPGDEFRFEADLSPGNFVKIELIRGLAELYGTELSEKREYKMYGQKAAIFTWHGCTLKVSGKTIVEYVGETPPMQRILNLHLALEAKRTAAEETNVIGPRVLIIGPPDVGKTVLVRTLVNYAVRRGRNPIYVNTDTTEDPVSLPGTITATTITRPISIEDNMCQYSSTSGTMTLAYYYGYADPLEKETLYKRVCSRLAKEVLRKLEDKSVKYSGCIVDTNSSISYTQGYKALDHLVEAFNANCIVTVGNERLYSELSLRYKNKLGFNMVKVPKSGGSVNRDKAYRKYLQMNSIRHYFYGTTNEELTAYSSGIPFDNIQIYRCTEEAPIPSSALPLGAEKRKSEVNLVKINSPSNLSDAVLALTNLSIDSYQNASSEDIVDASIAGFIHVSEVDMEKNRLTILSPSPGRLPKNYLVMGSLKWMEI